MHLQNDSQWPVFDGTPRYYDNLYLWCSEICILMDWHKHPQSDFRRGYQLLFRFWCIWWRTYRLRKRRLKLGLWLLEALFLNRNTAVCGTLSVSQSLWQLRWELHLSFKMIEIRCFKILLLPWNKLERNARTGFKTVSVTGIQLNYLFFWYIGVFYMGVFLTHEKDHLECPGPLVLLNRG